MTWQSSAQKDPWRCAGCGKHHPIKPLARDCEARHDRDARQGEVDHHHPTRERS